MLRRRIVPTLDGAAIQLGDGTDRSRHLIIEPDSYEAPLWVRFGQDNSRVKAIDDLSQGAIVQGKGGTVEILSYNPASSAALAGAVALTVTGVAGLGTQAQLTAAVTLSATPSATLAGTWPDNEPAGMTQILSADGSVVQFAEPDAFYGSRWLNTTYVESVADAASKFGNAIEVRTFVGDTAGWHGLVSEVDWDSPAPGDFNELYFRLIFKFSSNWQINSSGDKYFYWGKRNTSSPNQFYALHLGSQTRITNQSGSGSWSNFWGGSAVAYNEYHTMEIHIGGQTPSTSDGFLKVWMDDSLIINQTGLNHLGAETDFEGYQAFLYWGGSGGTKTVNDWFRVSEFYISGKA